MCDWRVINISIRDKLRYILANENTRQDVQFIVGPKKVKICAHSFILYLISGEFEKNVKINRKFDKSIEVMKSEVVLPDVDPEALKFLLKNVYTDAPIDEKIKPGQALDILHAAKMFGVLHLANSCEPLLISDIGVDNAINVYNESCKMGFTNAVEQSKKFILRNASKVFDSPDFCKMGYEDLMVFIESDNLCIDELPLFKNCIRWAKSECERVDMGANIGENLRNALAKIVPLLRFPLLSEHDFTVHVVPTNILLGKEMIGLYEYFRFDSNLQITEAQIRSFTNFSYIKRQQFMETTEKCYFGDDSILEDDKLKKSEGLVLPTTQLPSMKEVSQEVVVKDRKSFQNYPYPSAQIIKGKNKNNFHEQQQCVIDHEAKITVSKNRNAKVSQYTNLNTDKQNEEPERISKDKQTEVEFKGFLEPEKQTKSPTEESKDAKPQNKINDVESPEIISNQSRILIQQCSVNGSEGKNTTKPIQMGCSNACEEERTESMEELIQRLVEYQTKYSAENFPSETNNSCRKPAKEKEKSTRNSDSTPVVRSIIVAHQTSNSTTNTNSKPVNGYMPVARQTDNSTWNTDSAPVTRSIIVAHQPSNSARNTDSTPVTRSIEVADQTSNSTRNTDSTPLDGYRTGVHQTSNSAGNTDSTPGARSIILAHQTSNSTPVDGCRTMAHQTINSTRNIDSTPVDGCRTVAHKTINSARNIDSTPVARLRTVAHQSSNSTKNTDSTPVHGYRTVAHQTGNSIRNTDSTPINGYRTVAYQTSYSTRNSDSTPAAGANTVAHQTSYSTRITDSTPVARSRTAAHQISNSTRNTTDSTPVNGYRTVAHQTGNSTWNTTDSTPVNGYRTAAHQISNSTRNTTDSTPVNGYRTVAHQTGNSTWNTDSAPVNGYRTVAHQTSNSIRNTDATPVNGHRTVAYQTSYSTRNTDSSPVVGIYSGSKIKTQAGSNFENRSPYPPPCSSNSNTSGSEPMEPSFGEMLLMLLFIVVFLAWIKNLFS